MSTPKSEAAIEVGTRCASRGSSRRAVLVLQSADLQRVLQKSAVAKPAVVKAAIAGNTMGKTAANLPSQNWGEKRVREQSSSWWQGAGTPPASGSVP